MKTTTSPVPSGPKPSTFPASTPGSSWERPSTAKTLPKSK